MLSRILVVNSRSAANSAPSNQSRSMKKPKLTIDPKAEHGKTNIGLCSISSLTSTISAQQFVSFTNGLINKQDSPQPGGLKPHFIPNEGIITMSSTATSKRFKVLNKHCTVIQSLCMIKIDSITQLDKPTAETNHSLCSYLSSLPHSQTGKPLYHSIDLSTSFVDEGSNMVILTALPEHAEEAPTSSMQAETSPFNSRLVCQQCS